MGLSRIGVGSAVLFSFFLLSSLMIPFVFGSEENWNWIEVEKITGDIYDLYRTEPFNISSSVSVWRIVWEYEPRTDIPEDQTGLTINVYAGVSDDDRLIIISRRGIHNGNEQTRYFHEQGTFHLEISSNTQNFSVRIEKSRGYTPEPPTDNWAEVTRFIGSTGYTTNTFECDHVEWRIKWKYDPGHIHFPFQYFFEINVIAQKEDYLQDYFVYSSSGLVLEQEGILNFYDDNGKFFLNILASGSSTIIVEQNTDSRPIVESSNNWVEIAAYTGITKGVRNESFTSDCDEWRIRWSHNSVPGQLQFNFTINEVSGEYSETLIPENAMGIMYIFKSGSFNLTIHSNATRYSLIVEKNLEFIPEFPSWIILPLFLIASISVLMFKKRLVFQRQ